MKLIELPHKVCGLTCMINGLDVFARPLRRLAADYATPAWAKAPHWKLPRSGSQRQRTWRSRLSRDT
jgi:hypothetical protein